MSEASIDELKIVYRIPAAWRDLGLQGDPGKVCRSPFREDRNPSFSVFEEGKRWRDFATDETGTVIDFIAKARGCNTGEAIQFIKERMGILDDPQVFQIRQSAKWPELRRGNTSDYARMNALRGFSNDALLNADDRGFLHFGMQWSCGFWAVTDSRRALIELRRITGESWKSFGKLSERKAHCIGSGKNWPIGIQESENFPKLAFVEGAPDFIATFHFALIEGKQDSVAPVGMLGAGAGRLAPEALSFCKNKHVRFYPHFDEPGRKAVKVWARQVADAGAAKVEAFDFAGLIRDDGQTGKDLADVCRIEGDCFEENKKFWEVLP